MKRALLILLFSFISAVCFAGRLGAAPAPRISLAEPERTYIESHPVITASNEQKWAPFNCFDDGRPKGVSIDYLALPADKAGLTVTALLEGIRRIHEKSGKRKSDEKNHINCYLS